MIIKRYLLRTEAIVNGLEMVAADSAEQGAAMHADQAAHDMAKRLMGGHW